MKRVIFGTIAAAAIVAAAFVSSGSAHTPATTSLHLVSKSQRSVGFGPKHRAPRPGDRIGTGDIITGDDTGIDRVICTVMSPRDALCTAVARLSKGTLTGELLVSLQPGSPPRPYAITGGTGAYAGARGTAVVTDIPGTTKADINITLLP